MNWPTDYLQWIVSRMCLLLLQLQLEQKLQELEQPAAETNVSLF